MNGNGKRHSLDAPSKFQRVDAQHTTVPIEQRPAAVPGIDGGIGLDQLHAILLAYAAHHAAGDSVRQPQRRPDGDDFGADMHIGRHRERQHDLVVVDDVHLQNRKIHFGGGRLDARRAQVASASPQRDGRASPHYVRIGHDCAWRNEKPAPEAIAGFDRHDGWHRPGDDLLGRQERHRFDGRAQHVGRGRGRLIVVRRRRRKRRF